jgi:hypothetical protein
MTVWFFGGWVFEPSDAVKRTPGQIGYNKGVSMGGDLTSAPEGKAPSFLVAALKDPYRGNLARIQIIKCWLGHTKRFTTLSGGGDRELDANGKLPSVGNTVDVATATFSNTIGSAELITVWSDPDFDPQQPAF